MTRRGYVAGALAALVLLSSAVAAAMSCADAADPAAQVPTDQDIVGQTSAGRRRRPSASSTRFATDPLPS